jgi:phosphoribosylformimino-5-aminoimidazole carboxamide ribotide isomerase
VQVIPSIDVQGGRSRVVFWPGVASGVGAPTDQPGRIATHFVALGAPVLHVVDFDGARRGEPVNLAAIGAIASAVATPIQVAGGLEGAEQIRLAFAAGATRAVLATSVVDDPGLVRDCLAVAGDWLAVGLDPRPERLEAFPWRRARVPTVRELIDELAGLGVRRYVLGHSGSAAELPTLASLARDVDADLLVAGGVRDLDAVRRLRDVGVTGIILGEALLSGALDYAATVEAAA